MDGGWVGGWTDPLLVVSSLLDKWQWGPVKSWWQKLAQEERMATWLPAFGGHPEIESVGVLVCVCSPFLPGGFQCLWPLRVSQPPSGGLSPPSAVTGGPPCPPVGRRPQAELSDEPLSLTHGH